MKPIYLDYNATTPTDPLVVSAMLPYFTENFGNPSNTLHSYGIISESAVNNASAQIARLIGCNPAEITWNSGASEGNNSVVFGLIHSLKSNSQEKIHILTSNAEHLSVLNAFSAAERMGLVELDIVPVNKFGIVDVATIEKYIKPHTKLLSLIWVNNEIGSINPIEEISAFCVKKQIYFHTDATQAIGKVAVNLEKTAIDFLTFSAHKFYGPKGVGCLYCKSGSEIEPVIFGGGQQNKKRSGTLNVPAIVGAGEAAEILSSLWQEEAYRTAELIALLYNRIEAEISDVVLNGPTLSLRSPINLNLTFNKSIDMVLPQLVGMAFSQGSACSTTESHSSHVLKALGLSLQEAQRTIRLSIGRWTTAEDITQAANILIKVFKN